MEGGDAVSISGCERLHKALTECHRRIPAGPARESACRHLNRALADCLVGVICPSEAEAVKSLCSSGSTALKRNQCQQARLSLSVCLSSHQDQTARERRVPKCMNTAVVRIFDFKCAEQELIIDGAIKLEVYILPWRKEGQDDARSASA